MIPLSRCELLFRDLSIKDEAFFKLRVISDALNEGKTGTWYPIFTQENGELKPYTVEHQYAGYLYSLFFFTTKEIAEYAATQFLDLFKTLLMA